MHIINTFMFAHQN